MVPKQGTRTEIPGLERARHSRHGLNHTGNERRLHLGHSVIDRNAHTLVEDLQAEDLGRAHGAVLVGAGERDVEGQDLVGVPGGARCGFWPAELRVLSRASMVELIEGRKNERPRTGIQLRRW